MFCKCGRDTEVMAPQRRPGGSGIAHASLPVSSNESEMQNVFFSFYVSICLL